MSVESLNELPEKRNRAAVRERLRWIDGALAWDGQFNRSDLMTRFGISLAQASADIGTYNDLSGMGAVFNHQRKVFSPKTGFVSALQVTLEEWLRLKSPDPNQSSLILVPRLDAHCDESVIRQLLRCRKRHQPCDLAYFSAPRNSEQRTTFSPHSFFADGGPIYARGWDASRGAFADICVPHITEARDAAGSAWIPEQADMSWSRLVKVSFAVNPSLDRARQVMVEMECGMREGALVAEMRHALLPHVLRGYGLLEAVLAGQPCTEISTLRVLDLHSIATLLGQLATD